MTGPGFWPPPPPPSVPAPPEPLVLSFDPAQGWRQADTWRRIFIVAFPVLLGLWFLPNQIPSTLPFVAPLLLLSPATHYAFARFLRPYPAGGVSEARKLRHVLSAFGAAATVALVLTSTSSEGTPLSSMAFLTFLLLAVPGPAAVLVTAVWGVIECAVRASQRSAQPGNRTG